MITSKTLKGGGAHVHSFNEGSISLTPKLEKSNIKKSPNPIMARDAKNPRRSIYLEIYIYTRETRTEIMITAICFNHARLVDNSKIIVDGFKHSAMLN